MTMPTRCGPSSSGAAASSARALSHTKCPSRWLHAELAVEGAAPALQHLLGGAVDRLVLGVEQLCDLAVGQEVAARLEPEDVEHRARPEDLSARDVPVPQSALAAVERLVEALGRHRERPVGLGGARRLPVEGAAEQHEHAERHREEGGDLRDVALPALQQVAAQLDDGQHAGMRIETEHDGEGVAPVGELGELHVPLVLARRQEPRRRQDLEQRSPAQRIVPRQHRADHAARVGEQERAVEGTVGQRHRRLDVLLQRRPRRAVGSDAGAERHAEPSRRDLRMENGQAVVLDDVRAAADRQLQDERRPEGGEEECDQDGDEVAKRTLRNGDARPAWRGDGKPELSFLEEKFAELRFCHRVPLTPGKLCSWSLFLIATPFTDEESLQLFESNRGCLVQYSGGSPEACEGCPSPPTWEPCESRHRARHDLVGVAR